MSNIDVNHSVSKQESKKASKQVSKKACVIPRKKQIWKRFLVK